MTLVMPFSAPWSLSWRYSSMTGGPSPMPMTPTPYRLPIGRTAGDRAPTVVLGIEAQNSKRVGRAPVYQCAQFPATLPGQGRPELESVLPSRSGERPCSARFGSMRSAYARLCRARGPLVVRVGEFGGDRRRLVKHVHMDVHEQPRVAPLPPHGAMGGVLGFIRQGERSLVRHHLSAPSATNDSIQVPFPNR